MGIRPAKVHEIEHLVYKQDDGTYRYGFTLSNLPDLIDKMFNIISVEMEVCDYGVVTIDAVMHNKANDKDFQDDSSKLVPFFFANRPKYESFKRVIDKFNAICFKIEVTNEHNLLGYDMRRIKFKLCSKSDKKVPDLSVYEIPEKTTLHFFRIQRSTAGSIYRVTDSSKKLVHMIHKMMHVKLDPETKDISFELHLRDENTCPHNCLDYIGSSSDETSIVYATSAAESTIVVFPMEFDVEVGAIDTRSDLGPECIGITGKYFTTEGGTIKLNKDEALKRSLDIIHRNSTYGINPKQGMTSDGKPYMLDYSYRSNKTAVWMTVGDVCGYKIFTTHSFFPLCPGETYEVFYADRTCRKLDLSLKRTNCYHFSDNLIKKIIQIKEIICDRNRTIICMKNEIFEKINMFSMEIDIHNFDPTVPNEFIIKAYIVDYTTNAYGITCKHPNSAIAKEYEFIKELNRKWRDKILNKGLKSFHQEVLEKTGVDTKKLDLPDWMNMNSFVDYNIHDCFNTEKMIKVCRPYSYNDAYGTILLREMQKMFGSNYFEIEDIKFHGIATIVFWKDGTKTVVKCHESEKEFDIEKAIMAAFMKRALESKVDVPAKDKSMDRLLGEWVAKYEKEKEIEELKKPSNAKKKKTTRKKTEE